MGFLSAVGMALAGKMNGKDYRVYTVMGDGEACRRICMGRRYGSQLMYKLDNLCAVVDRNRLQISGNTEDVMAHR